MNDVRVNLPPAVRVILYILAGVLTPIIAVLTSTEVHILPSWAMLIWSGEVAFIGTMGALNVQSNTKKNK